MANDESIIKVIQRMVQAGESRESIMKALRDLGVTEEQSKRLMLIAEADTFTVLKREIGSLIKEEVDEEKKDLTEYVKTELRRVEESQRGQVSEVAKKELASVEGQIVGKFGSFENRVNDLINAADRRTQMVKLALDSINTRVSQTELGLEEVKVHKYRKSNLMFSYFSLALGALTLFIGAFILVTNFSKLDSQQMIMIAVLFITSIAFMFAAIVS